MTNPSIDHYMIHDPITIERGQPISAARRLMQTHHIRHLPVVCEGKLAGIVSQRDLLRVDAIVDLDPTLIPIGEVMTKVVYSVSPEAPLREVADQMAARHCGSVVVIDAEQRVVGLLTAGGGLRALSSLTQDAPRQV
jgi:CBS domain-containing protein